jgi:hypothetical protein
MTMRRNLTLASAIALSFAGPFLATDVSAQEEAAIQGAWVFTNEDGQQRGLLIFTESHYSMMFVRGDLTRATYPEDRMMTDAETLVAYRSITANSGRYSLDGDQLTVEAYMANDPNYMAGWPENAETFRVEISGDTMLWEPGGLLGLGETVTLRRVG